MAVKIKGLTHGYGGGRNLFEDANLEIAKGERVAIIGPNGERRFEPYVHIFIFQYYVRRMAALLPALRAASPDTHAAELINPNPK